MYELLVKEHFRYREKGKAERIAFNKGDVITDPEAIKQVEQGPFAHHVMRRAVPAVPPPPKPSEEMVESAPVVPAEHAPTEAAAH